MGDLQPGGIPNSHCGGHRDRSRGDPLVQACKLCVARGETRLIFFGDGGPRQRDRNSPMEEGGVQRLTSIPTLNLRKLLAMVLVWALCC